MKCSRINIEPADFLLPEPETKTDVAVPGVTPELVVLKRYDYAVSDDDLKYRPAKYNILKILCKQSFEFVMYSTVRYWISTQQKKSIIV